MRRVALRDGVEAHCSGALWLPGESVAMVADAHLGYGWAQRRRGELGPVIDGGVGAELEALLDELAPRRLIFLGDTVHAPRPGVEERTLIESTLRAAGTRTAVTVVAGNHDRWFRRDFGDLGFEVVGKIEVAGLTAMHGDRLPENWPGILTLGHLHPRLNLPDGAGVRRAYPIFVQSEQVLVLPAFSPFAAGCNLRRHLPQEWYELLGPDRVGAVAVTGTTAVRLPEVRLRPDLRQRPKM